MEPLPPLFEVSAEGADSVERWKNYIEALYTFYLKTVAYGALTFHGIPVRCRYHPTTDDKHFAFWHMMQEGFPEEDRTPDPERCKRISWISWVIKNADLDARIRVFPQAPRNGNASWVLWLHEERYAVILWERKDYYLLKTCFMVGLHKEKEFERDWNEHLKKKTGAAPCGTTPKAPSTRGG